MRTTERIFFRHIAPKILALRQQAGRFFVQSAEKISRPLAHPDLISASLYFLDKNGILFANGEKLIDDHTLVALTIMIAESRPEEKEIMIDVIMNCIS